MQNVCVETNRKIRPYFEYFSVIVGLEVAQEIPWTMRPSRPEHIGALALRRIGVQPIVAFSQRNWRHGDRTAVVHDWDLCAPIES